MSNPFEILEKLQDLDLKIADLLHAKEHGPSEIGVLEKELAAQHHLFQQEEDKLKKFQADSGKRQQQLEDETGMIKMKQDRLPEIRNQKEYQASMREIEASRMEMAILEEDLKIIREKVKQQEDVYQTAKTKYDEAHSVIEGKRTTLNEKIAHVETELSQLRTQRAELVKSASAPFISKYERLRKRTRKVILLQVKTTSCPNCNMSIPPQRLNEIRRMQDVGLCDYCQLLLYWKEEPV